MSRIVIEFLFLNSRGWWDFIRWKLNRIDVWIWGCLSSTHPPVHYSLFSRLLVARISAKSYFALLQSIALDFHVHFLSLRQLLMKVSHYARLLLQWWQKTKRIIIWSIMSICITLAVCIHSSSALNNFSALLHGSTMKAL